MHATIDVRFTISIDEDRTVPLATLAEFVTEQNIERSNRRHGTVERPPAGASVAVFGSNDFLS